MSINQRKRLLDMSKIGGGDPITRRKGNLMKCTQTIHPTIMMNGMQKNRVIENTIKGSVPIVQGIVKK